MIKCIRVTQDKPTVFYLIVTAEDKDMLSTNSNDYRDRERKVLELYKLIHLWRPHLDPEMLTLDNGISLCYRI
jgi:hypothetical protein